MCSCNSRPIDGDSQLISLTLAGRAWPHNLSGEIIYRDLSYSGIELYFIARKHTRSKFAHNCKVAPAISYFPQKFTSDYGSVISHMPNTKVDFKVVSSLQSMSMMHLLLCKDILRLVRL